MSQLDWFKAGIDLLQAIASGAILALLVYWLDRRKAKRERQFEYFRIAASWSNNERKISMRGFDLEKTNLAGNSFDGVDLESAVLKDAELESINLNGANLRGANFTGANLSGAILTNIEAYNSNFSKTKILIDEYPKSKKNSNFTNSKFDGTSFYRAQMKGVSFHNASLISTDFSGAIVENCDFTNADLSKSNWLKVKGITDCIWVGVKFDNETRLSEKLLKEIRKQNEN